MPLILFFFFVVASFHVHLCKTALVDDKRVWAAVKPILGEEFKDEMASRAMYGPITDFAVSMDSQQANALDAIGFELAFHKPIGASSIKYAGETHHKPIWLWQCRLCSSHAIASVVFVNSEHAVNGGNNLIAVGDGHFISFKKAGESLKASYESETLFATPILVSLDPVRCCCSLLFVAVRCCSLLFVAVRCCAVRCCSLLFVAVRCCSLLFVAVRCCSLLFVAVRCCSLLFVAVRCCSLLFVAVRCCSLLFVAVRCCSLCSVSSNFDFFCH
jgi:hypothetical protein